MSAVVTTIFCVRWRALAVPDRTDFI